VTILRGQSQELPPVGGRSALRAEDNYAYQQRGTDVPSGWPLAKDKGQPVRNHVEDDQRPTPPEFALSEGSPSLLMCPLPCFNGGVGYTIPPEPPRSLFHALSLSVSEMLDGDHGLRLLFRSVSCQPRSATASRESPPCGVITRSCGCTI